MSGSVHLDRRAILATTLLAAVRPAWADGEPLKLSDFAKQGESSNDASDALVAAMRKASEERRPLLVDGRFSIHHDLPLPGPLKMYGRKGQDDGFDLLPPPSSVTGGIHGFLVLNRGRTIDGVSFEQLTFRGGFDARTFFGSRTVPVIRISPRAGVVHKNVLLRGCRFIDPVSDCIHVAPDEGASVETLRVMECEADVTVPLDRASRSANLVRTILAYQDWAGHKDSYGKIAVKDVKIQHCRARGIRTLSDIKRGTSDFEVSDCRTEDMSACHHSADGSFHGVFARVDGVQRSPLLKAANFIEVQGEDIVIRDFRYEGFSGSGAFAGIMITAYAFPAEGPSAQHQSKRIRILRGSITGIEGHAAVRLIDASDCEVRGLVVDDVTGSAVAVENPPGNLAPTNIVIADVKPSRGRATTGVTVAPSAKGVEVSGVAGFEHTMVGGHGK